MEYDTFVIQLCVMSGKEANRPEIDNGGKCLLPQHVFKEVSARRTPYPIMFELFFSHNGRSTHLGVLEFTAAEGTAIVPQWVLDKFHARRLAHVQFRTVTVPMGNFLRIRPMQKAFIELSNPKMVLENHLQRNFTALTTGDVFHLNYNGETYKIHVMEVRSRQYGKCPAVKFVSENMDAYTELIVEFERPADMPASPNRAHGTSFPTATNGGGGPGANSGGQIDFTPQTTPSSFANGVAPGVGSNNNPTFVDNTGKQFTAFSGGGSTISGKKPAQTLGSGNALGGGSKALGGGNGNDNNNQDPSKAIAAARAAAIGRTISGKSVPLMSEEEKKKKEAEAEEAEKKKKEEAAAAASAFGGAGRTLGGNSNNNNNARRPPLPQGKNGNDDDDDDQEKKKQQAPLVGRTLRGNTVPLVPNPDAAADDSIPSSPQTPGVSMSQREVSVEGHQQKQTDQQQSNQPHNHAQGEAKTSHDDDENKFQPFRGGGRKLTS